METASGTNMESDTRPSAQEALHRAPTRRLLTLSRRTLLAGAGAALAAACGAQSAPEAAPASSKGPVTLLYWQAFRAEHLNDRAVQMVFEDYQAKNPGRVTIEAGEGGTNVALAKVKASLAADVPPTMWNPYQVQAADLFATGGAADLNALLRTSKEWAKLKGELLPALVEGCSWKGKLTMMPITIAHQINGFNKRFLAEAGVPLPKEGYTWSDFLDIGRKTAKLPERALFNFTYNWTWLGWWMYTNGQRVLSNDRTKVMYDSPAARETLQWLDDQVTKTQLARNGATDFNNGGSVTETINAGTVYEPRFPNLDPGDGSGIHAIHYPYGPSNSKREMITYGNTYGLIVFKADAAKAAAAAEVAAWALRPDLQTRIMDVTFQPPTSATAAKDENLPRKFRENPILKALNDTAKGIYLTPNFLSWGNVTEALTEALGRVAKGQVTPKDALAEVTPRLQAMIDEDLKRP
jgi:ABC-type glycerol-3-phosphate transport system substrate-binding protein